MSLELLPPRGYTPCDAGAEGTGTDAGGRADMQRKDVIVVRKRNVYMHCKEGHVGGSRTGVYISYKTLQGVRSPDEQSQRLVKLWPQSP